MSSPGIDEWVKRAPESWAKLAKSKHKNQSFEQFKKKFFEGAEKDNKAYLKQYIKDDQLKTIYEKGLGQKIQQIDATPVPIKPTKINVTRFGKTYTKTINPRWGLESKFVLFLASKEKPRSQKYKEYVNILINQGRTKQAVVKKIQRTRSVSK